MMPTHLTFETLEPRRLLAGWQNPVIRFDVDDSSDVQPLDALLVINEIARNGSRQLAEPLSADGRAVQRYWDVNGDGWIVPLDALLVLNALHRNRHPLNLTLNLKPEFDRNGNGVVAQADVSLVGHTSPDAKVQVDLIAVDLLLRQAEDTNRVAELTSDSLGQFSLDSQLLAGHNRFRVTAVDEIGRRHSIERDVIVGDVIADWNAAMLNVIRDWTTVSDDPYKGRIVNSRPPEVARALALVHVAMFDAINAIEGGYEPYLTLDRSSLPNDISTASTIAAAATAAHDVAVWLYPQAREQAVWTASLAESLGTVPEGAAKQRGIDVGRVVAAALIAARFNDGANATSNYNTGNQPGQWNRTAPGHLPPMLPHWGNVKPLAVDDMSIYLPAPPPALNSEAYADAVDEVMRLGGINSNERTTDQTQIAVFWADGGGTATPPGHWNRIAAMTSLASGESTLQRSRALALLNLAMADVGIASWDAKYKFDLWRPIDAIRRADEDGNANTTSDKQWLPLITTPPFPAYTSGHSSFSGAAATVLTSLYGQNVPFASTSDNHTGLTQKPLSTSVTRQFSGFWDAANEASMSRVYGGIHFKFDCTVGLEAGQAIGAFVIQNRLLAD